MRGIEASLSYWGGILHGTGPAKPVECQWSCQDATLFVELRGTAWATAKDDRFGLFLRGYAVPAGVDSLPDQSLLAAELLAAYRESGHLAVDLLEGSFTVGILDGRLGRLVIYRNLIGTGFTYYCQTPSGLLFASNLAELVARLDEAPEPNIRALPAYFLYRFVPGRETLFRGVYRLMPGERLEYDHKRLRVHQAATFADLLEPVKTLHQSADRVETTIARIMRDYSKLDPDCVNLLSGGVDSTYLQVHWNQAIAGSDRPPVSAALWVDHPRTLPERCYARSASALLGTQHVEVPANGLYRDYLVSMLEATCEPPQHVQTAYFIALAEALRGRGVRHVICGEGADSVFGLEMTELVRANRVRRLLPASAVRRCLAALARAFGRQCWARAIALADHVEDLEHREHPVNRVAVFTHEPSLEACFGHEAVAAARAYRRQLLDRYAVPADSLERSGMIGLLGEAMDTASLWATCFNARGLELFCPMLDSRMLRVGLNIDRQLRYSYRKSKPVLKAALCRHVPRTVVTRRKLSFGQPIFEWLAPGGQLRESVEQISRYPFLGPQALAAAQCKPNWFLYSLLCLDLWLKHCGRSGCDVVLSDDRS